MATPKKKHLIELMIEAGVKWPEGAEYAAQDKNQDPIKNDPGLVNIISFYPTKPSKRIKNPFWLGDNSENEDIQLPSLCRNWHQTIVTLEQYSEALAANVGEPPAMASKSNQARESENVQSPDAAEWHNPPSIEQLAADYHAKAAEADRLQAVAYEATKAADDALIALGKACELLGLVISVDTKPKQVEQLEITDWRDLRVGDVVELTGSYNHCWKQHAGREMTVTAVYPKHGDNDDQVDLLGESGSWSLGGNTIWRFIRRP
jgi:hypothetical protein